MERFTGTLRHQDLDLFLPEFVDVSEKSHDPIVFPFGFDLEDLHRVGDHVVDLRSGDPMLVGGFLTFEHNNIVPYFRTK